MPIMEGEERSTIKIKIGGSMDGQERIYHLDLYFTPANQKGRLLLTNDQGEKIDAPKTVLKSIIGNIGFDVFSFLRSSPKKQVEELRKLTGREKDFFELDKKRASLSEERTYYGKKIDDNQAVVNNHGFTQEEIEKYSQPIDIVPIQAELSAISASMDK